VDPPAAPGLLDRVRDTIRVKHYSLRTKQAYVDWVRRFIHFHGKRHPAEMGAAEVKGFLTHLAVTIIIHDGKGAKDRRAMLPRALEQLLRSHIARVRVLHATDVKDGFGAVWPPNALARKYPNAAREWRWQYVFPRQSDPRTSGADAYANTALGTRRSSGRCGTRFAMPT